MGDAGVIDEVNEVGVLSEVVLSLRNRSMMQLNMPNFQLRKEFVKPKPKQKLGSRKPKKMQPQTQQKMTRSWNWMNGWKK